MKKLEWVPHTEWPRSSNAARFNVWRSEDYLAQAYHEKDGVVRLSVTGTGPNARPDGNDIPWSDLQAIKAACGYGAYDSEQGLAVGFSGRINNNVVTKVSVSATTQSEFVMGAGVGFEW